MCVCVCAYAYVQLELFSFDLETKQANGVSGVLIGSANTHQARVPSYCILERVHLSSCDFDLSVEQDSVQRSQSE